MTSVVSIVPFSRQGNWRVSDVTFTSWRTKYITKSNRGDELMFLLSAQFSSVSLSLSLSLSFKIEILREQTLLLRPGCHKFKYDLQFKEWRVFLGLAMKIIYRLIIADVSVSPAHLFDQNRAAKCQVVIISEVVPLCLLRKRCFESVSHLRGRESVDYLSRDLINTCHHAISTK